MKKILKKFSYSCIFMGLFTAGCHSVGPPDPIVELQRDEAPSWSPDGQYIAYSHYNPEADEHTNPFGLYVFNLETGEHKRFIEGPAFSPDWSPCGEWIAFNSGDIFKIRPDGSDVTRLTEHGNSFNPRWSPDGNTISYGRSGSQEVVGLWFLHLPDATYRRFGFGASPADWSPDGGKIVYGARPQDGDSQQGESQIWIADTSNTNNIQLSANDFRSNRSPSWSPDGEWITWQVHYGGKNFGIWVMRIDGSNPKEILSIEINQTIALDNISPSWSPDSQRIVFSKPNSDESKVVLWIINRDGSGLQEIAF